METILVRIKFYERCGGFDGGSMWVQVTFDEA